MFAYSDPIPELFYLRQPKGSNLGGDGIDRLRNSENGHDRCQLPKPWFLYVLSIASERDL